MGAISLLVIYYFFILVPFLVGPIGVRPSMNSCSIEYIREIGVWNDGPAIWK
jgi:hypothetical protein